MALLIVRSACCVCWWWSPGWLRRGVCGSRSWWLSRSGRPGRSVCTLAPSPLAQRSRRRYAPSPYRAAASSPRAVCASLFSPALPRARILAFLAAARFAASVCSAMLSGELVDAGGQCLRTVYTRPTTCSGIKSISIAAGSAIVWAPLCVAFFLAKFDSARSTSSITAKRNRSKSSTVRIPSPTILTHTNTMSAPGSPGRPLDDRRVTGVSDFRTCSLDADHFYLELTFLATYPHLATHL